MKEEIKGMLRTSVASSTVALTYEQQKELLLLQMEKEKLSIEKERLRQSLEKEKLRETVSQNQKKNQLSLMWVIYAFYQSLMSDPDTFFSLFECVTDSRF